MLNNEFRGAQPSAMELVPERNAALPGSLNASYRQLVIESLPFGDQHELVVRDAKTGFTFFNISGSTLEYDPNTHGLSLHDARLLLSREYAAELGGAADTAVGTINVNATMRAIEVTELVNGEVTENVLPAAGTVPGPDVYCRRPFQDSRNSALRRAHRSASRSERIRAMRAPYPSTGSQTRAMITRSYRRIFTE